MPLLSKAIKEVADLVTNYSLLTSLTIIVVPVLWIVTRCIFRKRRALQPDTYPPRGHRKLGYTVLDPEWQDKDYQATDGKLGPQTLAKSKVTVKAIVIYPIKSCSPVMLDHGTIIATGIRYDRRFAFAELVPVTKADREKPNFPETNEHFRWRFITQREYPLLASVKTEIWIPSEDSVEGSAEFLSGRQMNTKGRSLIVSFPDSHRRRTMVTFTLSLDGPQSKIHQKETVQVWVDYPSAINVTSEIPGEALHKLKTFLSNGKANKLKNMALFMIDGENESQRLREVYRCAPKKEDIGYQPVVGFADAYPLHLLSLGSVRDVEGRLPPDTRLNPLRFRANIYVTGCQAFTEDTWKLIRIGSSNYHVSSRTARCNMPNVDPTTGIRDSNEPMRAMSEYRRVDQGCPRVPCLGMQVTPIEPKGEIRVGDEIEVLEVGEHFYLPWLN
ncbi:MAG: hypothetical protein M1820_010473 [Bogoriella megaspora]|nr:MAG: hypothetical protein M1820_010473 [Bogoriella megaspora]